jgi:beta-carotene hydroxylase
MPNPLGAAKMLPRFTADFRSLLWAAAMLAVMVVQYARPNLAPFLFCFSLYLSLSAGVIGHNHSHCPIFESETANLVFEIWLSIFYGYPTFSWLATHNAVHHKYVNRIGDATLTWRHSQDRKLVIALTYFFVCRYHQQKLIRKFVEAARIHNQALHRRIRVQYCAWWSAYGCMAVAAIVFHGIRLGLALYICTCIIPPLFAHWLMMLFNYETHGLRVTFQPFA